MNIIAGRYRRQQLKCPKGKQTRPTSSRLREALFNICQAFIEEARFLDIFAGSGAMGLEALSRGASAATFIESDKEAIRCIEDNIAQLKVSSESQVLRGEVFAMLRLLERQKKVFDVVYVDPPYRTFVPGSTHFYSSVIIEWIDRHELLAPGAVLFIEEAFQDPPQLDCLQTLVLVDSRRMGQAVLQQYRNSSS